MHGTVVAEPGALLEREHEVERVRGAMRSVGRREGLVIVIEGAAGIGKSRLLEVARTRGSELGYRGHRCSGVDVRGYARCAKRRSSRP